MKTLNFYSKMTIKELKEEAKRRGIRNYNKMTRRGLEDALHEAAERGYGCKTVTVDLITFNGMYIGTYTAEENADFYAVTTKNGKILMFNFDGKQVNAKNPKYANRIRII